MHEILGVDICWLFSSIFGLSTVISNTFYHRVIENENFPVDVKVHS